MSGTTNSSAVVEKPEAKKAGVETWVSAKSPNHMVLIKARDASGNVKKDAAGKPQRHSVKFKNYRLDLDLSNSEDLNVSKELREVSLEGHSIFRVLFTPYPESGKQAFLSRLDELLSLPENDGVRKLMALFSPKELREAGIALGNPDASALKFLALTTRSFANV